MIVYSVIYVSEEFATAPVEQIVIVYLTKDAYKMFVRQCAIPIQNVRQIKFARTDFVKLVAEVIMFVLITKPVLIRSVPVCYDFNNFI